MTQVKLRIGRAILLAPMLLSLVQLAMADNCSVVKAHVASAAEQAFLAADYAKSVELYRADLAAKPNDPDLTAGLVRVLLRQQNTRDAGDAVEAALKANSSDKKATAVLLTAKAEVQLRRGLPWEIGAILQAAQAADICVPRLHLVFARFAEMNSQYAIAQAQLKFAHQLDAYDPDIRGAWIQTLPLRDRIEEMERYLASATGDDSEERHRMHLYLDHMKKSVTESHKSCRLVSKEASTVIPFALLMYDSSHIRSFGLDVKLNQHKARLEIDTGAGGLLVSKSVAEHAGLKPFSETSVGGIGDQGGKSGYTAFAESIQIGGLEFHDCAVDVVENSRMMDIDGLIGMDVLGKFLVTLDYPERKLMLGPLPPRPGEAVVTPSLGTSSDDDLDATKSGSGPASDSGTKSPEAVSTASPDASHPSEPAKPKSTVVKGPFNRYIAPEMKDYTPVYREGHLLMLPVGLNDSKVKLFVLDTGAWATSISPEVAREVTKVHSDYDSHVSGLSGEVKKVYEADQITFKFEHLSQMIRQVPSFDTSRVSKSIGMEISGFLGARTLEMTTMHIDYRDGLVKFDYDEKKLHYAREY
jgi:predicted aspartyl protease